MSVSRGPNGLLHIRRCPSRVLSRLVGTILEERCRKKDEILDTGRPLEQSFFLNFNI